MIELDAMFAEHAEVVASFRATELPALQKVIALATECIARGGKILVCGNGGSAADAQHFAAECIVRFERTREAIAAIALTTDTSTLTAVSNDFGFEQVFARQIAALGRPGDVLFAISTSGKSPNILAAATRARERQCHVVAFTGRSGSPLSTLSELTIAVPSACVARVQEIHEICLHVIAAAIEDAAPPR